MSPQDFKGAARIILLEIGRFLSMGQHPSYTDLQDATGYSHTTIWRALNALESGGALRITRNGKCKLEYELVDGAGV